MSKNEKCERREVLAPLVEWLERYGDIVEKQAQSLRGAPLDSFRGGTFIRAFTYRVVPKVPGSKSYERPAPKRIHRGIAQFA